MFRFAAFLTGLMVAFCVTAQTTAPTAEQLRLLQQLPPEQREAALRRLTGDTAGVRDGSLEFPELVVPLDRARGFADSDLLEDEELRVEEGSTIIVEIGYPEDELPGVPPGARGVQVPEDDDEELDELPDRVRDILGSRVYRLDRNGVLDLPGFDGIRLAGLTAEEAAIRIQSEPDLNVFEVIVSILPLKDTGPDALERFGYDLFEGAPTTFAPATDIPVPSEYKVGPGDTIQVQLYGNENVEYTLVVNRDGVLNFPEIGPIPVVGQTFQQLKDDLEERVSNQKIGVDASITMGPLRSIRVFILGDAENPGSYTVSSLSTITNALFVSGGVKETGSLRQIELKRQGETVARLDLYDLLLNGDTSGDRRLQPGDVIFIPPVGDTVGVAGEVKRPAIYEVRSGRSIQEIVDLAGGLMPTAYPGGTRIDRISATRERTVINVDLDTREGRNTPVQGGDIVQVHSILEKREDIVVLSGHVNRPGGYQWRPGMYLTDLLPTAELLKPQADMNYVLIRREIGADRRVALTSVDLNAALVQPRGPADTLLLSRDEVNVFSLDGNRAIVIEPLIEQMRIQANQEVPELVVGVSGRVRGPGRYPLDEDMRVSELIKAAGGLVESSYTLSAELTRYAVVDGEYRQARHINVDLSAVLAGNVDADLRLEPHDFLSIKEISQWREPETVEITGEVKFPGTYVIRRGETLKSVVERAGGATDLAFPEGSVFTRESLRQKEQEQLDFLTDRLERDLAALSLTRVQEDQDAAEAFALGQSLVAQLRGTQAVGRLVIDVDRLIAGGPLEDIVLQNGDKLYVPERTQEVTVIGEVQYSTSHIHNPALTRDDYINSSGGLTSKADKKRIYVVRANGSVQVGSSSRWFRKTYGTDIRPGDTIVVPLDADRVSKLTIWTNVSQIIFQLGVLAAAATN